MDRMSVVATPSMDSSVHVALETVLLAVATLVVHFFMDGDTIIGVVSFSFNNFDCFIRVDRYLDWISSFTGVRIHD